MLTDLWEHVLSGGLQFLKGETSPTIKTYFTLPPIQDEKYFPWESILFEMVKTIHAYKGENLLSSYGLFFRVGKTKIFITTDTQFLPENYMDYYRKADIIFHDCETDEQKSGVHAYYNHLVTLDPIDKIKNVVISLFRK